jgi:ring-1,2-phenylacetyl-CoA epoxidase subunit PaaD
MPGTTKEKILSILETVTDPEVPVLSVIDLGIIRKIELLEDTRSPSGDFGVYT